MNKNSAGGVAWTSFHIYLASDASDVDRFIVRVSDALHEQHAGLSWFFVRYWTGGNHVRLRVRGPEDLSPSELARDLSRLAAEVPATRELDPDAYAARVEAAPADGEPMPRTLQPHGAVCLESYVPETARYGGEVGVILAEETFLRSSELVVEALRHPRFDRMNVGLNLLLGALHAHCKLGLDPAVFTMRYLLAWQAIWPRQRQRAAGLTNIWSNPPVVPSPDAEPSGIRGRCCRMLVDYARAALDADLGTPEYGVQDILISIVHMSMNRLGLTIDEEHLLLFIAHPYAAQLGVVAHRDHYVPWEERLGPYSETYASSQGPSAKRMAPSSDRGDRTAAAAMGRRQSAEDFTGKVSLQELQDLLERSFAYQQLPDFEDEDGERYSRQRRGYPSAGMLFPVFARLVLGDGFPIAPGLYDYHPETATIEQVFASDEVALTLVAVRDCLPQGFRGAPAAAVWLCSNMPALRSRYRNKADRFAMLEAGHLAQNMLLIGTELGLAVRPLGGFYDDIACIAAGVDGDTSIPIYSVLLGGEPKNE